MHKLGTQAMVQLAALQVSALCGRLDPVAACCRDAKAVAQSEEEARFDVMRRELVYEARGAPSDRARTAEELADLERQRLEVSLSLPRHIYVLPFLSRKRVSSQNILPVRWDWAVASLG